MPLRFRATASLAAPRFRPAAEVLPDGRVAVFGGAAPAAPFIELFDPTTERFTLAAARPGSFYTSLATCLLPDARVLILADTVGGPCPVQVFDPATGGLTELPPMHAPRSRAAAAPLADGRVLVAGGWDDSALPGDEIWDPRTNRWELVARLRHLRYAHTLTPLPNGAVLAIGGQSMHREPPKPCELWSPATARWSPASELAKSRFDHAAVALSDGAVAVVGGSLATLECWGPVTHGFARPPARTTARSFQAATLLPPDRVLLTGGVFHARSTASTEIWTRATNAVEPGPRLGTPRQHHAAVRLHDGRVLVIGGQTASRAGASALAICELLVDE